MEFDIDYPITPTNKKEIYSTPSTLILGSQSTDSDIKITSEFETEMCCSSTKNYLTEEDNLNNYLS
jgi:hypothetical protein